jgi:hypothetical protein
VGDPTARGTNRLVGGGLTPGNVLFYGASVRRIVAQHPRSVAEAGDPAESDYQSDLLTVAGNPPEPRLSRTDSPTYQLISLKNSLTIWLNSSAFDWCKA